MPARSGCGYVDMAGVPPEVLAALGLRAPDFHHEPESLVRLARALRDERGLPLCVLPFCCTLEAEALGAVVYEDASGGAPRVREFVYRSLRDVLLAPPLNPASGRLGVMLEACARLHEAGEGVALELAGPMTILNGLLELAVVFREWRKEPSLMDEVLTRLLEDQLRYAGSAVKAGVNVLCVADPAGGMGILGPQWAAATAKTFVMPLLQHLEADLPDTMVHVCPRLARELVENNLAVWRESPLEAPQSYGQLCLSGLPGPRRVGRVCIKNSATVVTTVQQLCI